MSVFSRVGRGVVASLTGLCVGIGVLGAAAPAQAATVSNHLGWSATSFQHFRVDVGPVVYSEAHGTLVYAVVCVRSLPPGSSNGKTRISWDPWRITTTKGSYTPKVYDASHPPQGMFPKSRTYAKGDCAGGWIPFATAKGKVTKITYANSLGNKVSWTMPPNSATKALGTTKAFSKLSVKVYQTKVSPDRAWAGAKVRVCVTSHAGYPKGVPVNQKPWTLTTNRGVFTTRIMQEGSPDFGTSFPWSTKLKKGQCATGWVAFALAGYGSGVVVKQVNYRNTLGNAVSWKV